MPDTDVRPGTLDDPGMTATPPGDLRNGAVGKCFHPADDDPPADLRNGTVGKCFHPADDDPPAALWRSLTEIDTRALAVLAGR